ncbi:DUF362 domain-containing protein, partial [Eubacteriales bacterium OttesenSCG-928-N13]|nr:DUF362 domain-containing protein [Eubacteriales bacterium OttesenSCG-928-N13]
TLADSPGGPYSAQMLSGVYRACDLVQLGDVLTLNQDFTSRQVPAAPGCSQQDFAIITPVLDADYIINLPKMKTHGMTTLSLGVKNLFGCIPGLLKPRLHYSNPSYDGFAQMLTSLTETVKPNLTLIDAVEGMEGNGPGSGTVRHRGLILASRDIFAQDYVAAQLMGVDPRSVLMIQVQLARGLIVPEQIERIGDDALPSDPPFVLPDHISRVDFTSHLPKPLQKPAAQLMDSLIKQVPLVDQIKCIGCGKCAESCPQHIIEMNDRKADIHLSKCISCFCCQEMCPVKAISVRRKFRFLK